MKSELVSVVIPNYNYARYVAEAVESVLAQTYKNIEIIVVDNGSTDNSLEVLGRFGSKIQLIAQENQGQAGARNRGIRAAQGEFIAFLDADDLWMADKIEKQLSLFSNKNIGLVYCGFTRITADRKIISSTPAQNRGNVLKAFATATAAVVTGGESTALVRVDLLKKAGEFDPRLSLSSGWDMWRRLACICDFDYVPEPLMLYRQHGANLSLNMKVYEHDTKLKLEKMFSDPLAQPVHYLKSLTYAKYYWAISGGYWKNKERIKAFKFLHRALFNWPPIFLYAIRKIAKTA